MTHADRLTVPFVLVAFLLAALWPEAAEAAVRLHLSPGYMRDIDVGANGAIFAIGGKKDARGNGRLYEWTGTNWESRNRAGHRVTVDRQGHPWLVNVDHEIWRRSEKGWQKLSGAAIDIDAGADGSIFVLGTDKPAPGQGSVYEWTGGGWRKFGGYGERIAVDDAGRPWIVNGNHEVWRSRPKGWTKLDGKAWDIASGGKGQIWKLGYADAPSGNGKLHRWDGSGWVAEGGYGRVLTVDHQGKPAVINSAGELWSGFFPGVSARTLRHGRMRSRHRRRARGDRPTLVMLVEYADMSFRPQHDKAYFRQLIFTGDRSVAGHLSNMSGGKLTLSEAGIVGPVRHTEPFECAHRRPACPNDTDGKPFWTAYTEAMARPKMVRFNFKQYDDNGDGKITDDELMVIVISAMDRPALSTGGVNRPWVGPGGCVMTGSKVQLCTSPAILAEGTGHATFTHELLHTLGTVDIYGEFTRLYNRVSLMGATVLGPEDEHEYYQLDPWHAIQLGWTKPRIVLASPGAKDLVLTLEPNGRGTKNARPIAVVDPTKLSDDEYLEYFLIEYRSQAMKYDRDVHSTAVRVWAVRQDRNTGKLWARPSFVKRGDDAVLQTRESGDDAAMPWPGTLNNRGAIRVGTDQILQSRPQSGSDDELGTDAAVVTVGPGSRQSLALSTGWAAAARGRLRWISDRSNSDASLEVLPHTGTNPSSVKIKLSFRD
jgi:M6 family metalloprotease-like protein